MTCSAVKIINGRCPTDPAIRTPAMRPHTDKSRDFRSPPSNHPYKQPASGSDTDRSSWTLKTVSETHLVSTLFELFCKIHHFRKADSLFLAHQPCLQIYATTSRA